MLRGAATAENGFGHADRRHCSCLQGMSAQSRWCSAAALRCSTQGSARLPVMLWDVLAWPVAARAAPRLDDWRSPSSRAEVSWAAAAEGWGLGRKPWPLLTTGRC